MWNDKRLGNADSAEIIQILKKTCSVFPQDDSRSPPAQQTTSYLHHQTHRLHPEPCVLEQLLAACRAEPEVFWCTAGKCVFVQKNHNDPEPANITNQSVWETVLREREREGRGALPPSPVGSACRGLPSWGEQSRTDSLRNVSTPKRLFVLSDYQPAQNKERTSMFGSRGVWTQTGTVCDCVCWV